MECSIEARALKSSFLSEMAMKSTQQAFFDDVWGVNGINGVSSDDFSVDVFLDFSDKDFKDGSVHEFVEYYEEEEEEEKDSLSISSQDRADDENSNSSGFSGTGDYGSLAAGELAVPVDDLKELEWLSEFVDDSASELSLLCPTGSFWEKTEHFVENRSEPGTVRILSPIFPAPVPAKARSKRSRPSSRVWSVGSLSSESSSLDSSSSSSSTASVVFPNRVYEMELFQTVRQPVAKKQKKKPAAEMGSASQRRCSHCHVQKTPQWRTGPLGPKSLCNACGVRFKSGRLFPEYRPACSPTFSGDVHSNSHRKVLEMRRKKEVTGTEASLTPIVSSF